MSRRRRVDPLGHTRQPQPCPVCGGCNRTADNGCWDCFWDDWPECRERPDEQIMPNCVSFNEAKFILEEAGLEVLHKVNQGGPKASALREQYRALRQRDRAGNETT